MMRDMATATGRAGDAARYADLYGKIRAAFQKTYIKENGEIGTGTQTANLLALHMHLVPDALKEKVLDNLVRDIDSHNGHLTTGFLGTPHLLFVLADNERTDVAYRLLLNDTFPSWGYMLIKGATTWWERWNCDSGDPSMNSFNHYAFGSVVSWVYRYVAGIDTAADAPGFHRIVIHPRLDPKMPHAAGEYESVYGKIATDWTASAGSFKLKIQIPANTSADVYLPSGKVTEAGKPVTGRREGDSTIVQVGSGSYAFEVR